MTAGPCIIIWMRKELSMTAGPVKEWSSIKGKQVEIRFYGRPID
jgi:hypothetical protein